MSRHSNPDQVAQSMTPNYDTIAASANTAVYDDKLTQSYISGSPHLKYRSMRRLYEQLSERVFEEARKNARVPRVLDLGAGEGSATSVFLGLGANVTAVDVSESQLSALRTKCCHYGDRLHLLQCEIREALVTNERYDIVLMSSVLHHIPDYIASIKSAIGVLGPTGQFFSFQDPIRYDTLSTFASLMSKGGYLSWRVFQADVLGGLSRRLRRSRGIYLDDCPYDNAEYHVTRNGVDQVGIQAFLAANGFDCDVISYFSTHAPPFQFVGSLLSIKNTFAIVARRKSPLLNVTAVAGGAKLPVGS